MNKNISINISGIIFHIDEHAFEKLKNYLDSIHNYFSSYEGSSEIIADIESRIAELFLGKLNESKQIITAEDVEALIATMGSVKDFEAAEEEIKGEDSSETYDEPYEETESAATVRKLYRDMNRRILSGVAAGIARYFSIDPLWIRLLLVLLALGSYGFIILIYALLWIVLPENYAPADDQKIKKMYRNPEDKVLGGVSAGIAAYFGVDVTLVRILFIVFAFLGGSGLIAYIILWIILPEARSITDRMQMQGNPITLSNIEENIKNSLKVKSGEEENLLVKIILFPFRLIAAILNGLGKALGPLLLFIVDIIRIFAGLVLVFIGFSLMLSLVIVTGVFIGLWPVLNTEPAILSGIPLDIIVSNFPLSAAFATLFFIGIPSFFVLLVGASIIARRLVFNATTGWTMFGIFMISLIIMSFNIPMILRDFQEKGEYNVEQTYDIDKIAVIKVNKFNNGGYDAVDLKIRGHENPEYKLIQQFKARGRSPKDAEKYAQQVIYNVERQDSILFFDNTFKYHENAAFRAQELDMTLYIPYGKEFVMDRNLRYILKNTLYPHGYDVGDLANNRWMFLEDEGLKCITCSNEEDEEKN